MIETSRNEHSCRVLQAAGFDLHSAGPITPRCRAELGAWAPEWVHGSPLNWSAVLDAAQAAFPVRFKEADGSGAASAARGCSRA